MSAPNLNIQRAPETRMERMKDAWEGLCRAGRMAHETTSVLIVYQNTFEKKEERQRACVCVWSV